MNSNIKKNKDIEYIKVSYSKFDLYYIDIRSSVDALNKYDLKIVEKKVSKEILKLVLINEYNLVCDDFHIIFNKNGKPSLKNFEDNLNFSVAHSNGMIVLSVGYCCLGVDIELLKNNVNHMNIDEYEMVFKEQEIDLIKSSKNVVVSFYKVWTLKEAIIKALGLKLFDMRKILITDIANYWNIRFIFIEDFITSVVYR